MANKLKLKSFLIAALGTMFEYYDYTLFSIFLPVITPVFFPASSLYKSLVMGYYAMLVIALTRPVGGIVFGYIGDRFGRKLSLIISMLGISITTLLLGVLPSYQQIGAASIFLLIIVRSCQLLCFGGEYNGAGIYAIELYDKHPNLASALLTSITLVGSVLASLVGLIIVNSKFFGLNWRIAFIVGGVFGLIILYYRNIMIENYSNHTNNNFFKEITRFKLQILAGFCIGGFITIPFSTVLIFINPILLTKNIINKTFFMELQLIFSIIAIFGLILSGIISERIKARTLIISTSIILIILAYPLCKLIDQKKILTIFVVETILIIINELALGPANAYLKTIFPKNFRYQGIAFSFCLGMSISGGLNAVIENYLYIQNNTFAPISIWLIFIGFTTFIVLCLNKSKY